MVARFLGRREEVGDKAVIARGEYNEPRGNPTEEKARLLRFARNDKERRIKAKGEIASLCSQ